MAFDKLEDNKPVEVDTKEYGKVEKKVMATELHWRLSSKRIILIMNVVGFFLTIMLNNWLLMGVIGIFVAINAYIIAIDTKFMKYLENNYNVPKFKLPFQK